VGAAAYRTIHTHTGFGKVFTLAADTHGNLYLADQKHSAILKLSPTGHLLLKDVLPKKCGIGGVAASPSGDVYAVAICPAVSHGLPIYHFSASGRLLQHFGPRPPGVTSVALDGHGHVYINYGAPLGVPPPPHSGRHFRTVPNRYEEFSANGKPLRASNLFGIQWPQGIAVTAGGALYMTAVQGLVKVSPGGRILRRWTQVSHGKAVQPGPLTMDRQGNAYTTRGPGDIVEISAAGQVLGPIVKFGLTPSTVVAPTGLAIDGGGHLFVDEMNPNRIKEFTLSGRLLAIWTP
jgi:hypothetical protein